MRTLSLICFALLLLSGSLFAQLSLDSVSKAAGDALLNEDGKIELPSSVTSGFQDLMKSFNLSQLDAGKAAKDALAALGQGEDATAMKLLNDIQSAGLNDTQLGLLQDLKIGLDQYVLKRNFGSIPEFKGPVNNVMGALGTGDPQKIQGQLSRLLSQSSPTSQQKALLTTMLDQYKTFWPGK
jgi:hypothetical protein